VVIIQLVRTVWARTKGGVWGPTKLSHILSTVLSLSSAMPHRQWIIHAACRSQSWYSTAVMRTIQDARERNVQECKEARKRERLRTLD
jgi:hypothetical protein